MGFGIGLIVRLDVARPKLLLGTEDSGALPR